MVIVSYRYKKYSFILRDSQQLQVLEVEAVREIFGPKEGQV